MNQPIKKEGRSIGMIITALAVVAVLCVAPIGSYIFLKGGFDYRLESLNQLQPKELDDQLSDLVATHAPFQGNARLIHIPGSEENDELVVLREIDNQIVDRSRFDIISFASNNSTEKNKIDFKVAPSVQSETQYVLIDTSNIVRGTYAFEETVGKEIIRHLSVVIPLPPQREISLNREKN